VVRWFGHITQRAIRRGSFRTVRELVRELVRRIEKFVQHHNADARPFAGTATADSILARLQRLLQAMSGSQH
jgi:putative transposase